MKHSSTKSFGAWLTNLQHHIFRDWSATKTERNRRVLNQIKAHSKLNLKQSEMR